MLRDTLVSILKYVCTGLFYLLQHGQEGLGRADEANDVGGHDALVVFGAHNLGAKRSSLIHPSDARVL